MLNRSGAFATAILNPYVFRAVKLSLLLVCVLVAACDSPTAPKFSRHLGGDGTTRASNGSVDSTAGTKRLDATSTLSDSSGVRFGPTIPWW